ncbi:MAG: SAM-dependent methyltransferase [Candidatus Cyclobacteriaceae bacterium M3_2C_046]
MADHLLNKGSIFLIPSGLSDHQVLATLPVQVLETVSRLDYFLVENIRSARRFISSLKLNKQIDQLEFEILDKNTTEQQMWDLLQPVIQGKNAGIISEAGCPGVADPGSGLIGLAHQLNIVINPLVGPSSFLLALMSSGLNGQAFTFHGYLPINKKERAGRIKLLEKNMLKYGRTQIFMETPYRNNQLLADLLAVCQNHTRLCLAKNLTASDQMIRTRSIEKWKKDVPDLHKVPVVFLMGQ